VPLEKNRGSRKAKAEDAKSKETYLTFLCDFFQKRKLTIKNEVNINYLIEILYLGIYFVDLAEMGPLLIFLVIAWKKDH